MSGHESDDSSSPPELCSGSESDESLQSDAHESDEDAHESDREDSADEEPPELLPGDSSEMDSGFDDAEDEDDDDDEDESEEDDERAIPLGRDGGRHFILHNLAGRAQDGEMNIEHEERGASIFGQMLQELAGIPANRIFGGNGLGMVGVGGIRFEQGPTEEESSHSRSPPPDRPFSRQPFRRYRSLSKRERRQQQPQQAPDEIRRLLWDEAFVDSLLAELPGVNKDAFQIQAALKDLRGPKMKVDEVTNSKLSSVGASSSVDVPNSDPLETCLGEGPSEPEPDLTGSSPQVQASPL